MKNMMSDILRHASIQALAAPGAWAIVNWLLGRNDLSFVPGMAIAGFVGTAIGRWIYLRRREASTEARVA